MNPLNPFYLLLLAVAAVGAYYSYRKYHETVKCNRIAENAVSGTYVTPSGQLQLT